MARQVHSHLTYANVMATLAVILALGGGIAWAALGRNSVKSKQIAPNAVGTSELKTDAATGADVAEVTLGRVPSADTAQSAQEAANAQIAQNAETLDSLDSSAFLPVGGKAADANRLDGLDSSELQRSGANGIDTADAGTVPANGTPVSFPVAGGTFTYSCPASDASWNWTGPTSDLWLDSGGANPLYVASATSVAVAPGATGDRHNLVVATASRIAFLDINSQDDATACRFAYQFSEYKN